MHILNDEPDQPIRIKRYANRRLYNTVVSRYVTMTELWRQRAEGIDVVVHDAVTGEDITSLVFRH